MGSSGIIRVGWWWGAALSVVFCTGAAPLAAQDRPSPSASACRFPIFATGQATRVIDGRSFMLSDGREVRLAAIEVPPAPEPGDSRHAAAAGTAAKAALESILSGESVELRWPASAPALDRYGRILAYVEIAGSGRAVIYEMLASGYARVSAHVGNMACAAELFSRERVARRAKLGLWADPGYVVLSAGNGAELLAERGRFTVVEGKVFSVRESGGTIYVNFGRRWAEALTVTILKRHERIFSGAGVGLKRLENRVVRVRGWVDERNGPRIEATRPEQIEIAELN